MRRRAAAPVRSTIEIGDGGVTKFENRGKYNKRFYWKLEGV